MPDRRQRQHRPHNHLSRAVPPLVAPVLPWALSDDRTQGEPQVFKTAHSMRELYRCVRDQPWPTLDDWQRAEAGRFRDSGGDAAWRFRDALAPEDVAVDLGAYQGDFSAEIRHLHGCRVLAFEPVPEFFQGVQDRFQGDSGVEVYPYGLAGVAGTLDARLDGPATDASPTNGGSCRIELRPFSEVMGRLGVERIGLLKVTIEGGEYELLEALSAGGWLPKIGRLQIQWHPFGPRARSRRAGLTKALAASHRLQWRFDWILESWALKKAVHAPAGKSVDVIIPAHNAEKFIGQAMGSVLAQTLHPESLIVVDDGSQDRTAEVVETFARSSPDLSVRLIRTENRGPNAARNAGLACSSAPFVAFLDADDFWDPAKLGLQMKVMERSPDVGLVFCGQNEVDAEGRPLLGTYRFDRGMKGSCARRLLWENKVTGSASAVLLRRSVLRDSGWFEESLRCGEDWEAWGRMARFTALDYTAVKAVTVRRHSGSNMVAHRGRELAADLRVIGILAAEQGCWGRCQARLAALWRLSVPALPKAWLLASAAPASLFEGWRWVASFPLLVFFRFARAGLGKLQELSSGPRTPSS